VPRQPPSCLGAGGETLACSTHDDRGFRSGVYELDELMRADRRQYCASPLFRQLFLEDPNVLESDCRAELAARRAHCAEEVSA
jgi:hypothetical protein